MSDKKDYEKIYSKYLDYVDILFYQYYMSGWEKANQHSPTIMLDKAGLGNLDSDKDKQYSDTLLEYTNTVKTLKENTK